MYWLALLAYTGEPGIVVKTVSGERRRVAGRADERRHLGVDDVPIVSRPLPPSTVKVIGARSTATTSPIRPARSATAAAELPGEEP